MRGPKLILVRLLIKIFANGINSMNGFYDTTKTHNILVLVGEIAALDISEWKG
jgi:hypothetical protein